MDALPMLYPRHFWRSLSVKERRFVLWGSAVAIVILTPLPWLIYFLFLR